MTFFGPGDESPEYTEGPVIGECRQCGHRWTISVNASDTWRRECPGCGAEGDYLMDPPGGIDGGRR